MKTKGLLNHVNDFVISLPDIIRRRAIFLCVCLWTGHELKEIPEKRPALTWQPDRECKRCGMIVEINYADRNAITKGGQNPQPSGENRPSENPPSDIKLPNSEVNHG